jgi:putative PIN family toxin of toxin-antitoxin system
MQQNKIRIILDTNLWISFLLKNDLSKIDFLFVEHKCVLIFSEELYSEFIDVAKRPKFKKYFSKETLIRLTHIISEYSEFIETKTFTNDCRDLKDNFLLALSIDGKADFLLTGDKNLLELDPYKKTKIKTISEFIELLKM